MKKMRLLSLAVAAVLCAGFVSCGDDDDDEPQNPATENTGGASGDGGNSNGNGGDGSGGAVADAVDLGLPSGTLWASWNVGATAPEEYGGYYAWGEIEEKDVYNWSTYKWCNGSYNTLTKYCVNSYEGTVDNKTELEPEDDVAHMMWGDGWRMPTYEEQKELADNCIWTKTNVNGVYGVTLTSKINGNSIFLPRAGCRIDGSRDVAGCMMSSTLHNSYSSYSMGLSLSLNDYGQPYLNNSCRERGNTVRPVKEK